MPTLSPEQQLEAATMRRVSWRLMPFLLAAYLIAYIDRVNVGFAALQMNKAVGLDPKTYGLGAGIFFIGYFIFEVPSNLALQRFGARTWIARIMISWGVVLRGLRPDRGADLVPGAAFPAGRCRSRLLPRRNPLFHLLVSGALSRHHRRHLHGGDPGGRPHRLADLRRHPLHGRHPGLGGWQWIFLLEAAPAVLLGIAAFVWLTDRPEHATWLRPEQRQWLAAKLAGEAQRAPRISHPSVWRIMSNKYVLILALVYAGASGASTVAGPVDANAS